ncbi:hypothetical protein [Methylocucumis oryzae]|uniref:Uncharacterized protein n=1 Tax=Methylocucumis oryzae TaxID=1632867 RepID=A0A0F3IL63_9GAMM|nr:hypothetical protein [Methylocucumis oryzae]KJV07417.1 hypothetical protein VZ94_04925 [Methylocucumis oryzae]
MLAAKVYDPYNPYPMRQIFAIGAKVVISGSCGGWRDDSKGVIISAAESVPTVKGEDYFYWVQFDTPQHDLSDDGPYYKAQILSRCLKISV